MARVPGLAARALIVVVLASIGTGGPRAAADEGADRPAGRTVVVWISIDGVRPDYLDRDATPVIERLRREGAYSMELIPIFPSLTFSNHVSQATGVKVAQHGVSGNTFYDSAQGRTFRFPPFASLLEAEPIWQTAARQGLRVAVHDWPLSHAQEGEITAAYFNNRYDSSITDQQRMSRLMDVWQQDREDEPLRLLMGYIAGPDQAGHAHGPDAPETTEAMREADGLVAYVVERALAIFRERYREEDSFYLLLTTDHGMSECHTLVHLGRLAGLEDAPDIEMPTSANVGNIFFTGMSDEERAAAARVAIAKVHEHSFARAYLREDLPPEWGYAHPTRVGDVIVVLETGYTFSRRPEAVTAPVADHGGPLGMHGYDPRTDTQMLGPMVIWRFPEPLDGRNLGQVHSLQLHATVARLLGITPAEGAAGEPIDPAAAPARAEPAEPAAAP